MFSDCSQKQFMVNVIEQTFDVELDYPVIFPVSTPHHRYRIQGRSPGSITVRVGVKDRLEHGLENRLDHRLCYSIGDSGHP
jgi:hypothetical protein